MLLSQIQELIELDKTEFLSKTLIPVFHNLPTSLIRKSSVNPYGSLRCFKWFAIGGLTRDSGIDPAMMSSLTADPYKEYCNETKGLSPSYQVSPDLSGENVRISKVVEEINALDLVPGSDMPGTADIPDAVIGVRTLDPRNVSLKLQVNDMLLSEYHTSNGFTKTAFRLNLIQQGRSKQVAKDKRQILDSETSWPVGFFSCSCWSSTTVCCLCWTILLELLCTLQTPVYFWLAESQACRPLTQAPSFWKHSST